MWKHQLTAAFAPERAFTFPHMLCKFCISLWVKSLASFVKHIHTEFSFTKHFLSLVILLDTSGGHRVWPHCIFTAFFSNSSPYHMGGRFMTSWIHSRLHTPRGSPKYFLQANKFSSKEDFWRIKGLPSYMSLWVADKVYTTKAFFHLHFLSSNNVLIPLSYAAMNWWHI